MRRIGCAGLIHHENGGRPEFGKIDRRKEIDEVFDLFSAGHGERFLPRQRSAAPLMIGWRAAAVVPSPNTVAAVTHAGSRIIEQGPVHSASSYFGSDRLF